MITNTRETVVGVFSDRAQAEKAVTELRKVGITDGQIGVITDKHDAHGAETSTSAKLAKGAEMSAATGAGVGALWALGIAAAIFPPLGFVAGGTLLAVLTSAGIGAAAATVAGALINLGLSEGEAKYYEGELKSGRTLVTVKAGERYMETSSILRRFGAYDMETKGSAPATI